MGALVFGFHELFGFGGTIVNDPDVKAAISELHLPAVAALMIAIFGVVTIAVRLRTVTQATDSNNQIVSP